MPLDSTDIAIALEAFLHDASSWNSLHNQSQTRVCVTGRDAEGFGVAWSAGRIRRELPSLTRRLSGRKSGQKSFPKEVPCNAIDTTCNRMARCLNPFTRRAIDTSDPKEKPDPYGDWALLGGKQASGEDSLPVDGELLNAAREAWPRGLAHARRVLADKRLDANKTTVAAEVWEGV